MRRLGSLAVVAVLLVACGGDDDDESTTTESTTSTESTTTTEATTTTLSQDEQDKAAIRGLSESHDEFFLVAGNPSDPAHPLIDELYVDPIRQRTIDLLQADRNVNGVTKGTFDSEIVSIEGLGSDEVRLVVCYLNNTYTELPSGERTYEGSGVWEPQEVLVRRTPEGWRIYEDLPMNEPCEPSSGSTDE